MTPEIEARLLLMRLEKMGPVRAHWLLQHNEGPVVVDALRRGILPPDLDDAPPGVTPKLVQGWGATLRTLEVGQLLEQHHSLGIELLSPFDAAWPFDDEPDPPVLLFHTGDLSLLELPRSLAIVGTRRCTTVGRTVAYEIGRGVARSGVGVVSGLALGVDGAAHRGALDVDGAVIGVVGSGLDVVYPGGNRRLWDEVATRGLLLSEAPAGAKPERWRFPARNRLIASLSQGVVIVESHSRGGALLTVDEAVDRGRPVFSVPGSVLSPASDGTNELLVEGATPVRHAADVLGHLGLSMVDARTEPVAGSGADATAEAGSEPGSARPARGLSRLGLIIMAETATGPVHLDRLLLAAAADPTEVLAEVQVLVDSGRVILDGSTVSRI